MFTHELPEDRIQISDPASEQVSTYVAYTALPRFAMATASLMTLAGNASWLYQEIAELTRATQREIRYQPATPAPQSTVPNALQAAQHALAQLQAALWAADQASWRPALFPSFTLRQLTNAIYIGCALITITAFRILHVLIENPQISNQFTDDIFSVLVPFVIAPSIAFGLSVAAVTAAKPRRVGLTSYLVASDIRSSWASGTSAAHPRTANLRHGLAICVAICWAVTLLHGLTSLIGITPPW